MTKEYVGRGSIHSLKEILLQERPAHVFLVTGKHSYEASGAKKILDELLAGSGVTRWSDFEANPNIRDVEKGVELLRGNGCDLVIAVGGGSVIDMAKLVNSLCVQKEDPARYVRGEAAIEAEGKPLVAIPTTAGTGSEVTHFAVCYIDKIKYSLAHPLLIPSYAIVDAQFTDNLPHYETASTGMDAFSQAVESFWNKHATEGSKQYAREAIQLAKNNIVLAVNAPTKGVRDAMSEAAYLAGKAINITKTTAPHAVSYPLTAFFGVPHGHAVCLTLPAFSLYNGEGEGVSNVMSELFSLLGVPGALSAKKMIEGIMNEIGLERRLSKLGVRGDADIDLIIQNVNTERMSNNPRPVNSEFIRGLCKEIF